MVSIREKGKRRRRTRILEAARQILATEGLDGLSTRKLAEEAELSVHTLYKLIGNKNDILVAVMRDNHDRIGEFIDQIDADDAIGQIMAIVQTTYDILLADDIQKPLMYTLMLLRDLGKTSAEVEEMMLQERSRFEHALKDAVKSKILQTGLSVQAMADSVNAIYIGELQRHLSGQIELDCFYHQVRFGLWLLLSGAATDEWREQFVKNARKEARAIKTNG